MLASGCQGQQPQQPSVLHQLYPGIRSLKEALLRLADAHGLRDQLALALVREGDPAAYSRGLLDNTLVSVASNAPPLPQRFSLQQHSSQAEVWCTPVMGDLWLGQPLSIAVNAAPPVRRSSSVRWRCSRGRHAGAATCCARAFARCPYTSYLFFLDKVPPAWAQPAASRSGSRPSAALNYSTSAGNAPYGGAVGPPGDHGALCGALAAAAVPPGRHAHAVPAAARIHLCVAAQRLLSASVWATCGAGKFPASCSC